MKIVIVGLGYVGLPLALAFSKISNVVGYDINKSRVSALTDGYDFCNEVSRGELLTASNIKFTSDSESLRGADYYIVTVPTPVDAQKMPDLSALIDASQTVGRYLSVGATVVYESTVYPGATEEVCIPILEDVSGLKLNTDFGVGYSPERINPGDNQRRLCDIVKVTSGSDADTASRVDNLYKKIIVAGTHLAPNIRTAEAAKVIENTQRDLNISLMNELSIIFAKMGLVTREVLEAAKTKWNFHDYRPGLVGGHCIGVDPYYLTFKATELGYNPKVILAGREVNDAMGTYVAQKTMQLMKEKDENSFEEVLVLGYAFKENCPDIRNTKVQDIIDELLRFNLKVTVFDPLVELTETSSDPRLKFLNTLEESVTYDAVILAVPHAQIISVSYETLRSLCKASGVFVDVKGALQRNSTDFEL